MKGGLTGVGHPRTQCICNKSLVGHWHHGREHVQMRSYEGMVLSGVQSSNLMAFIVVKQRVEGWANNVLAIA